MRHAARPHARHGAAHVGPDPAEVAAGAGLMSDSPQPPPILPVDVAERIHQTCDRFEDAWGGPTRPQLDSFLASVLEPERSWLLAELLALEVELRRAASEQPTEAEYRQAYPGEADGKVIAAAFRR